MKCSYCDQDILPTDMSSHWCGLKLKDTIERLEKRIKANELKVGCEGCAGTQETHRGDCPIAAVEALETRLVNQIRVLDTNLYKEAELRRELEEKPTQRPTVLGYAAELEAENAQLQTLLCSWRSSVVCHGSINTGEYQRLIEELREHTDIVLGQSGKVAPASKIDELSEKARRIIDKYWAARSWPPDRDTIMLLMQLATDLGQLQMPSWKPKGVNNP